MLAYNSIPKKNKFYKTLCIATVIVLFSDISSSVFRKAMGKTPEGFSILFLGDILLANEAEKYINTRGKKYPFLKIKKDFRRFDFIFANLETPITSRGKKVTNKAYSFRASPENALCIKELKLDAVSLANNHLMDYNHEGLEDTLQYLDRWNIAHAGGGKNIHEARKPIRLNYHGTEILIFSYCNRPPEDYYADLHKPGTAPLKIEYIKEDIDKYRTADNILLISLHWGIEQTDEPQSYQIEMAHQIIDAGADGIIGHHPHWPQGIEVYKEKPIIYSLGNFINGYYNYIEKDNIGVVFYYLKNRLLRIQILPVAGKNRDIHFQPFVMTGKNAERHLTYIQGLSSKLQTAFEISNNSGIIDFTRKDIKVGHSDNKYRYPRTNSARKPSND